MSVLNRFLLKRLIGRLAHDAVPIDGVVFPRDAPARSRDLVSRVLKNSFNPLLMPDYGWPDAMSMKHGMHSLMCLPYSITWGSAAKNAFFSQATLKKAREGFFQQPVRGSPRVRQRPIAELDLRAFPRNGANFR
jgi:hypothetical protein